MTAIDDFSACLAAMPNCDTSTLAETRADPLLTVNTSRVAEWNGRLHRRDREQFRFVIEVVELAGVTRSGHGHCVHRRRLEVGRRLRPTAPT